MTEGCILAGEWFLLMTGDEWTYCSSRRSELLLVAARIVGASDARAQPLQRHITYLDETSRCIAHVKLTRLLIDRASIRALSQHHMCRRCIINTTKLVHSKLFGASWSVRGVFILN